MDPETPPRRLVYVIGCPGAGKGTLCSKLALHYGWAHISVGDELRRFVRDQRDPVIESCVRSNELVPAHMLVPVILNRIRTMEGEGWTTFILDGFPRHVDQVVYVQDKIGMPEKVILMDCPEDVARERVLSRNLRDRMDSGVIFEKRFGEFRVNNPAIVQRYAAEGRLVLADTSGPEDVSFAKVLKALGM